MSCFVVLAKLESRCLLPLPLGLFQGVPAWDSVLSIARVVEHDPGLSTAGDFNGMVRFYPAPTLASLRGALLMDTTMQWSGAPGCVSIQRLT